MKNSTMKALAGTIVNGWLTPVNAQITGTDLDLMTRLLKANDQQVPGLLNELNTQKFARKIGFDFAILTAAYCSPQSAYYKSAEVLKLSTTYSKPFQ